MFGGALQPVHLIVILVIVLIVFGPGKLSDLGGSLGKGLSEFRRNVSGGGEAAAETAPAAPAGPRTCSACGTENPAGNQFCGGCGAKLG